ncbi:MAG: hypothetical protein LBD99_02900, partial [Candidatus Margulisbacteria bacterium]|nr:hypothetical protein [Candidatus Margulisiibacteriota bacterium]
FTDTDTSGGGYKHGVRGAIAVNMQGKVNGVDYQIPEEITIGDKDYRLEPNNEGKYIAVCKDDSNVSYTVTVDKEKGELMIEGVPNGLDLASISCIDDKALAASPLAPSTQLAQNYKYDLGLAAVVPERGASSQQ